MGRPRKELDLQALLDMAEKGTSLTEMADTLGVSAPTIRARIDALQEEEGLLLKYRDIRGLHLTKLQAKCLEAISDEKIDEAGLLDLVRAFKILNDAEVEKKDGTKVTGLVAYLIAIEKEAIQKKVGMELSHGEILDMAKGENGEDGEERNGLYEFSNEDAMMKALL
jgi:DNA-binding Lrp family transcriptional regulator